MKFFKHINAGSEKYPALTGIRAAGATVVFFDHFPFAGNSHLNINVLAFFFVLSGFLITRLYYNKLDFTGQGWRKYFVNRFARIYPVYFLLLTAAVLLKHDFSPWLLIKNYTLTHALFANYGDFIIQPSWSLTVEECFYFLAPFIMLAIKRVGFFGSLIFGGLMLVAALVISQTGTSFLHTSVFVFSTTFFGHFFEFYAGIYLALVVLKKEEAATVKPHGLRYTMLGACGVALLTYAMQLVYSRQPLNQYLIVLINNFLIPVPIAVLYYGLICERSLASRLLSGKIAGLLGRASYTFYLLHTIIIAYVGVPFVVPVFGNQYVLCAIFLYVCTYALSVIIFVLFEEPVNLLIRKKWAAKKQAMPATPAAA